MSKEHRLPACRFWQPAGNILIVTLPDVLSLPKILPASCRQLQAGSLRSPKFRALSFRFRHSNHAH
jgi:hypothetical protein